MARFRATIQGYRGEVSRLGTASSGISAKVNGWDVGVNVFANVDENGKDFLTITMTSGSNGKYKHGNGVVLGIVREGRTGEPEFTSMYQS